MSEPAAALLQRDHLVYRAVLAPLKLPRAELSRLPSLAGVLQVLRAQQ